MKLSKLIENLQETLEKEGDKECLFWADSIAPDADDLVKNTSNDEEWVKYLTDHLAYREPLFVDQSIETTKKDGSVKTYNFVIL